MEKLADGLKEILTIISSFNRNITSIDLSYNKFTLNDFNNLTEYLKTNPILNLLDISGNRLSLQSSVRL